METDRVLLDAAKSMDETALAEIFDLYAYALYKYALRLCNDSLLADQIVGDVFAKLLDKLSCGNGPWANLRSYFFETTYHLIVDEVRYSNRRLPLELVDLRNMYGNSASISSENHMMFEITLQAVHNNLTDYQRHVIVLRFFEGFSLRETASILGKSAKHIKSTQNRAIKALRKVLNCHKVEGSLFL